MGVIIILSIPYHSAVVKAGVTCIMAGMRFSLSPVRPPRWYKFIARLRQRRDLQALHRAVVLERQKMASMELPREDDRVHAIVEHILDTQ
ncbi:MAG TPA: hypothetical protein VM223_05725 [Planctomycetota bacterium]|nr:hypothetical protein [Planctomycetota bacterium]